MFSVIKNYIRSKILFRGTKRIKHQFKIERYCIYIDVFFSYDYITQFISKKTWNNIDKISYIEDILNSDHKNGDFFKTFDFVKNKKDFKIIKLYYECILSRIGSGINVYINTIEVKNISDIRNDKLNKLLSFNR